MIHALPYKNGEKASANRLKAMSCTYTDDFVGVHGRHFIGVGQLMWSSD
jgi:hypothetical protein